MTQRLFLSTVTSDFGPLRQFLAQQLRPSGFHVVHQSEFIETGRNTLVKLAEFVDHESDIVLHCLGPSTGSVPPREYTDELLRLCGEELRQRFPTLFTNEAFRRLSYTQWEAWLGCFYAKLVLPYQSAASAIDPVRNDETPMSIGEHLERLKPFAGYPTPFTGDADLLDKVKTALLRQRHADGASPHRPCHLPYSSLGELFIGRETFLAELRKKFEAARTAGHWPNHAVCGVGGQGKTQVAVEYALRYRDKYTAVLMINGDTPESLRSGLAGLAGLLFSDLDPSTTDDIKEKATLDWLEQNPGWLLIVDNADTEVARDAVTARLSRWANGHVLITARFHQWPNAVEILELHVLSVDDGARFLRKATDGHRREAPDDERQARLLAGNDLDGLCLALEQAAAYIAERNITFAEYRDRWAENAKEVRTWADRTLMQYHPESDVSLSVATTWLTTFQQLPPASQALLRMVSWLAPDPIPQGLIDHPELQRQLQSITTVGQADSDIEQALIPLRRYSLLSHRPGDPADSAGRVHRVMQLITREQLPPEQQRGTLVAMLQVVSGEVHGNPADVRTWPKLDPLRPHLTTLIEHAERAGIDEPTSWLMGELGVLLSAKALHREAEDFKKRALALDERHYGADSTQVATRLNNLAQTLQDTNRLAEAEPLMRRALTIDERVFGAEHPTVAIDLNNLAALLQATNRLAEAEPLMRRALAIDEQSYGAEHPDIALDLNNLAGLLQATNRLVAAEPLMRRALAIDEQSYGAEHPKVATRLNNLAQLLQDTNRLSEAEPLMRRALAIDEQSYGAEHPKVATRLNNLAQLLQDTNRLSEAEPLMRRALAIDEQSYGAEHPKVAIRLNNLALLLDATNRLTEAEPLMRRALAIDEQAYGAGHPSVARDLNNLAQLLQDTNGLAEAEPLMRRALAIFVASLGAEHPSSQTVAGNYRRLLQKMKLPPGEIEAKLRSAK